MPKKIPLVEIIKRAENVHGVGRYDYSLITEENYKGVSHKYSIKCNKCDTLFFQSFHEHIGSKHGCPNCGKNQQVKKRTFDTDKFIEKSRKIHKDKYDYSKVEYINNHIPVNIICYKHGVFSQIPQHHLRGNGCPKCGVEKRSQDRTYTTEQIIEKAKEIHGNIYDYSKVKYTGIYNDIIIICREHGEFTQSPHAHITGKQGCPYCKKSHGEEKLAKILEFKNIEFISEYRFNDCRDKYPLSFDFYLPEYNTCIEYDGEQHFIPMRFKNGKEKLIYVQYHDSIKTNYCKQNNIPLLRIKYDEDIETKLNQFLYDKKFN